MCTVNGMTFHAALCINSAACCCQVCGCTHHISTEFQENWEVVLTLLHSDTLSILK